jgi:endonuclease YncB( thermonuclease family)
MDHLNMALLAGFLAAAGPSFAGPALRELVGVASVSDGDTIEIHDQRIRLDGIDAPESSQLCVRAGAKERCGQAAALFLDDMIGKQTVRCETHDVDRYGRDISTCWRGDMNINEAMVTAGQAVAYQKYSRAYVEAEEEARAARLGIWATEFEMPWDYRRNR